VLWAKQQLVQLQVDMLNIRYVMQHDRAILRRRLHDQRAAAKHPIGQAALVGHFVDPVQRELLANFVEDATSGDQAAGGDRVRGGPPAQERQYHQPDRQDHTEASNRELSGGTGPMWDQRSPDADCRGDEDESERRQDHCLDMGPGMDDHALVAAEQLLRKSHVLNADTPSGT
jgi:hypothetical protein